MLFGGCLRAYYPVFTLFLDQNSLHCYHASELHLLNKFLARKNNLNLEKDLYQSVTQATWKNVLSSSLSVTDCSLHLVDYQLEVDKGK